MRQNTIYRKGLTAESSRVKFLWAVLEKMREEDRVKFIKFCWAQERLPAN